VTQVLLNEVCLRADKWISRTWAWFSPEHWLLLHT